MVDVPETSSPDNQARAFVESRAQGAEIDTTLCEREPIRIPGLIQPHGALIGIDPKTQRIVMASANLAMFAGTEPAGALGVPMRALLPTALCELIGAEFQADRLSAANPERFSTRLDLHQPVECWVHARGELVLVELEAIPPKPASMSKISRLVDRALTAFRDIGTLSELNERLVASARELTGFERILIYRFDADWNGITVAESMVADWDQPFLGLRFPASDIPRQARELYTENALRLLPLRDYAPVPLMRDRDCGDAPIDLSGCRLRSQSPVHLEYQRNIGVDAAMSASILKAGQLWGMLVGHHRQPHRLSGDQSAGVARLVTGYAMRLHEVEDDAIREQRREQQRVHAILLQQMAGSEDFAAALTQGEVALPNLFGSGGAALVQGDAIRLVGHTPPAERVRELADTIRSEQHDGVMATDNLASRYFQFEQYADTASGVLALPLRDERNSVILWFRPEVASTVVWAGDPRKSMVADGDGSTKLLPRRSFERWVEQRRGYSAPWHDYELEAATRLGGAIEDVILRQSRRMRSLGEQLERVERLTAQQTVTEAALQVALQEKDSLLAQKDLLLREVDHRIRNSLALISSILNLQARTITDAAVREQFSEASQRVATVAHVHQRLFQTGKLHTVEIGQYLAGLLADVSKSVARDERERLEIETTDAEVPADTAVSLGLIINELVTNAYKHRRSRDLPVHVKVSVQREDGLLRVNVADNGGGLPDGFDPAKSTGLGMRLVNGLLQRLEGTLSFSNQQGGTHFKVEMPYQRPA